MVINEINPDLFNDPLALKTDWKQCNMLGSNFCSEKLVRTDPNRVEFRRTKGVLAMYIGFIAVGAAILILSKLSSVEAILFGLMFILIGAGLILFADKHTVFDKTTSSFSKGRRKAEQASCDISSIHAIQLIAKIVRGKKSYYCYELNLVLNNVERINIISHGNKKRIRADANALSEFLAVPVWDAIE